MISGSTFASGKSGLQGINLLPDINSGIVVRMTRKSILLAFALLLLSAPSFAESSDTAPDPMIAAVEEAIRVRLETLRANRRLNVGGERIYSPALLSDFYGRRAYRPAWSRDGRPTPLADEMASQIGQAAAQGLVPGHYHSQPIAARLAEFSRGRTTAGTLADVDLLLTDAFLALGSHYLNGRIKAETIDPEWQAGRRAGDPVQALETALSAGAVAPALKSLLPPQAEYAGLLAALDRYQGIAAAGGWAPIRPGPRLQAGDRGPRVAALRAHLAITGDLADPSGDLFDAGLAAAVRRYQFRHGLKPDGIVGAATLNALNLPVESRIRQIEVNLERWRWLPADLGSRYLLVNIADFRLYIMEKGRPLLDMRVVVGRPYRRTPVFSSRVHYLVLNPFWEVPQKIVVEDILPQVRKDPATLARLQMKIWQGWAQAREIDPATIDWNSFPADRFPYRIRQEPGPANALGRIKFMFPNPYDIYLHDTPARELFQQDSRSLSSGCIRVEKPFDLAEYLLRGTPLGSRSAILAALETEKGTNVSLPEPVPVHILYWTSWVDPEGILHFRSDVYGRDSLLRAALDTPPSPGGETAADQPDTSGI